MAPTINSTVNYSKEHHTLTHKLRKPLVEKLRRERINSSIEQLKSLLGPEFLKQQPDSKLEKADILEMTVCFMRQLRSCRPAAAVDQGYSRCVQEAVHLLSKDEGNTQSQTQLLTHFQNLQSPSQKDLSDTSPAQPSLKKDASPDNSLVWRPW